MRVLDRPRRRLVQRGLASSWLLGIWRSDKAKTMRRWECGAPKPEAGRREFVESQLGIAINRFTKTRWYHRYEDSQFSMACRVVWEGSNSVFVVYADRRGETGELITFLSRNTYWVQRSGYVEFFTKQLDT